MTECKHTFKTYIGSAIGYGTKLYACDDCYAVIAEQEAVDKLKSCKKGG